jgi:hypothetical protein
MIAMCDENLIGRILEQGDVYINIREYKSYYMGERISKENAAKLIKSIEKVHSSNVVGKESVEVGLETKIVNMKDVLKVDGVPYAQSYNVNI